MIDPFAVRLDLEQGTLAPLPERVVRRLSDLRGLVANEQLLDRELAKGDPIIYEVLKLAIPQEQGQLFINVTFLKAGRIGREYYFTKGHFHVNEKAAEVYLGLRGHGVLLLRKEANTRVVEMDRGTLIYIPPGWGHRTVNVSQETLVFLSIYPADAGHDYERVRLEGMGTRVFATVDGTGYEAVTS